LGKFPGVPGKNELFDYRRHLDYLHRFNHNLTRLWISETALGDGVDARAPMPYQRTGPGTAEDGLPQFDVTQFNQLYFDRLRDRVIEAGERGGRELPPCRSMNVT
jgi:hypothetical protein